MSHEKLKEEMRKHYIELKKSEFGSDKCYSVQAMQLYALAAGYAPKTPVKEVYDIIHELRKEV